MAGELALVVDEQGSPSQALLAHIDHCLSCQADLAHYRRLLRMLAELRNEAERLPAGVLADIVGNISRAAERRAFKELILRRRGAYLAGVGIPVLVVSALLAVVRARGRRSAARER